MADKLVIPCPECGKEFRVPASAAGKKLRCKVCGEIIPIAGNGVSSNGSAPQAATAAGDEDDGKPYDVTAQELGARCPECANAMGEGDVICLKCGYNIQSRRRARTRKVVDQTSGDVFTWLLPGILCLLVVISIVVFNILYIFAGFFNVIAYGFLKCWIVVISSFAVFFAGRFAMRRLIFHPKPPEVELR